MCGVVGIVSQSEVSPIIYDALTVLQHRGQDAAGIATSTNNRFFIRKQLGLKFVLFYSKLVLTLKFFLLAVIFISNASADEVGNKLFVVSPKSKPIMTTKSGTKIYPCNGYDLLSRIPLEHFESNEGNDSWGWTDSLNGKEYALMGLDDGTAFVDISNPEIPLYLGKLPSATVNSSWRDIKVFKDYAFIQKHTFKI